MIKGGLNMNKKFIVTQDSEVANRLIASNFQLVSQINGTYTFINKVPQHFNFNEIDKTKIVYTSILSL